MRLRQLFEAKAKRIIAVMPGGFHPFHPGHKSLYDWASKTFGQVNVYVAATNDTKARPFPFDVKQKLASMAGVPRDRFIQVKSPFNALSYADILDNPAETSLVFIRSEKDKTSHPLPDQVRKSDGMMGYLVSYADGNLETADTHGYIAYGPTIDFNFSGIDINSASQLREKWPTMSDEEKSSAAEQMYPGNAEVAVKLLNSALGSDTVTELEWLDDNVQESQSMPVAQKIDPLKIPSPPKAPDQTIPRTRNGYTDDNGVTYKLDKYNENIMHVSNSGGTFTFDGNRLIKWTSPRLQGYRQIHDLVRKTIKVDANTTVNAGGEDVLISTKAVYDLEGNLKNAGELGISAGGVGVGLSDKQLKVDYVISDNLSIHTRAPRNVKNIDPEIQKQLVQAVAKTQSGDVSQGNLLSMANLFRKAGASFTFKSPANGPAIPFNQGVEMLKQAGA